MMEANRREMSCAQVVAELHTTVWNRGDYAAIERLVAPRYVIHSDPGDAWDGQSLDRETYRERVEYSRKAFPDLEFVIHDAITEGHRVAVRWSASGTHLGDLGQLHVTGKRLTFRGQTTYELRDGRVAGHWQLVDRLGFVEQLGPRPGRAASEEAPRTQETPRAPEQQRYLDVTEEAGRAFFRRGIAGGVVMLNLLRFRAQADYSATPQLAPPEPIEGAAAYQKYIDHCRFAGSWGHLAAIFAGSWGQPRRSMMGPARKGAATRFSQGHGASSEAIFAASWGQPGESDLK